jgi:hypothetical protein
VEVDIVPSVTEYEHVYFVADGMGAICTALVP